MGDSSFGLSAMATPLPSLDWVLAELTGVWATDGAMVRCPLPGHDDSTPSFNLWDAGEDGVPRRWGCFGCGRKGDVVDLVAELEGLSASDAVVRCAQLFSQEDSHTYERPTAPKKKVVARDISTVFEELREEEGDDERETLGALLRSKGNSQEEFEAFVHDRWQWTGVVDGVVAIPHRNRDDTLSGIKYRAGDRKWSEDGSRPYELYGAWHDRGLDRVIVCEGESDTVWAAWALRDEAVDVFGLPSGASQQVRDEWLALLRDREVTIAFDSDEAGMKAAAKWCDVRPGTMVARLPEGKDIVSCGIPIRELLDHASVPRRYAGVVDVEGGVFVKAVKDGYAPIADFAFEPVRELLTDEGPAWEGRVIGDRELSLIRASDLLSGSTVTKWANRNGRSWLGGSGPGVQGLFNYLASSSAFLPLERATTKAGKIGRSYVWPGDCIGKDSLRYIPPAFGDPKLDTKLHLEPGPWNPNAMSWLETMNDPGTMAIIIGWTVATLLRGANAPAPPLFVSGESGAGKTNLLSTLLGALGYGTETNLTTTTPYGVDCMINSTIGFPVWFDEYRGGAREDSMSRLRQMLRDAYYGQVSIKGGMTSQATELTEVSTWSGIIVSGEMSSYETSHRDRIVMLELDPGSKRRPPYEALQARGSTAGMGRALLEWLVEWPTFAVRPTGGDDLPDRFRDALGFIMAGWDAWKHFRWKYGLRDTPVEPDLSLLSTGRREHEDPWLEALKACEGILARNSGDEIVVQFDEGVRVIPSEVIVEAKRIGIELPARTNELVAWLKRRYTVEEIRVGTRRAKLAKGMRL